MSLKIRKGTLFMRKIPILASLFILVFFGPMSWSNEVTTLPEVSLHETRPAPSRIRVRSDDSTGARLTRGKKTTQVKTAERSDLVDQNVRQAISEIPGLQSSDVSNQSFPSISFRGLGDPHESYNVHALEDGVPISADPFGYPALYYTPPFRLVEGMEFIRGGAALLYGPQPGGTLNFKTLPLIPDGGGTKFFLEPSIGNYGFFSSVSSVEHRGEKFAVRLSHYRRQIGGFRERNQDLATDYVQLKLTHQTSIFGIPTLLTLKGDFTESEFGEAGGLKNLSNPTATTNAFDRLEIGRTSAMFHTLSELGGSHLLEVRGFLAQVDRNSFRQNLGSAQVFGGTPNAGTNQIQFQSFQNTGFDVRWKQDFYRDEAFGISSATGTSGFFSDSSFDQQTGAIPQARSGANIRRVNRTTQVFSLFQETEFAWKSGWSLTPGIRLERISQKLEETLNIATADPLRTAIRLDSVPLLGLGIERELGAHTQAYFQGAQGYRPVQFGEALPLAPGATISGDANPARSISTELGVRGEKDAWTYDVSAFWIRYSDQLGRSGAVFLNTGRATHRGGDVLLERRGTWGSLPWRLGGNGTYLQARFDQGAFSGRTPQYAPRFLARLNGSLEPMERFRFGLGSQWASLQYADDANSSLQRIPGYMVLDAWMEREWIRNQFTTLLTVQNLLDRVYTTRIRANGIDPAWPRLYQLSVRWRF
jgi:Fe(3+) dicitrate transport protein